MAGFTSRMRSGDTPSLAAAANWLALATAAARFVADGRGLLIDIGSTTTDLIPLDQGKVVVQGRTDTERLRTGELVYAGIRRTPICAWPPTSHSAKGLPLAWPPSFLRRLSMSS